MPHLHDKYIFYVLYVSFLYFLYRGEYDTHKPWYKPVTSAARLWNAIIGTTHAYFEVLQTSLNRVLRLAYAHMCIYLVVCTIIRPKCYITHI